ncbi:MAG: RNA-protein complex protein Nop10 [Desulfurococcaceae archaeon]
MNWLMRKCKSCGKYTFNRDKCPLCGGELVVPHPPRFSPVDKYVDKRIKMKIESNMLDLDKKPSYVP